ncbi:MAG: hypothetical protein VKL39_20775 [Leptolyngbyaceae bacterium]|nr:hypothetical protein [Leptolyngbyaceae bacterium]
MSSRPSPQVITISRASEDDIFDDGIDREGMMELNGMECAPQMRNHVRIMEYPLWLIGDNCEKVGAAWCGCSTVAHWIAQYVDRINVSNVMEILTLIILGFTLFNPTYGKGRSHSAHQS